MPEFFYLPHKQKTSIIFLLLICFFVFFIFSHSGAAEWRGHIGIEGKYFPKERAYQGQKEQNISIAFQPEFYHEWDNSWSVSIIPFARKDSSDDERSHVDLRDFSFLKASDWWEFDVGIDKVFWGVTESQHLVDIINQTDLVENPNGEEKLGQPMAHLTLLTDFGTTEFFILPYFRERIFPGEKGRMRLPLPISTENVLYESSSKKRHVDVAVRYSHSLDNWDVGLSHFSGTGREPTILSSLNSFGQPTLLALYEQIEQTGLDLQCTDEEWLWKLEAIKRSGQGDNFYSLTGGFEYTFPFLGSTGWDFGLIAEWLYDSRDNESGAVFDNDIMIGTRLGLNDMAGTELLAGVTKDLDTTASIYTIEASRRFTDNFKLFIDLYLFSSVPETVPTYFFRRDSSIRATLKYYY